MEDFHIPRKKNVASSPAIAESTATTTSKIKNEGDVAVGVGGTTATPSKAQGEALIQSPDKSPGGRQILRRGDLVRLSNEQKSGRIQGGLARVARIHYPEGDDHQPTSETIYDIEYILGGKVNNVSRYELEYTTATAEGLIDTGDGTRGLRRQRAKREMQEKEDEKKKQKKKKKEEKKMKKQQEKIAKKQNIAAPTNATVDESPSPTKRKRGRPPKNPKKVIEQSNGMPNSSTKRPRNNNSNIFERPPTSRQLANMEKEGATVTETSTPTKKKKKTEVFSIDRPPTSRQLANLEKDDAPVESSKPTKKSGKANTAKSGVKRKNSKAAKEVNQKNYKRNNSVATSESGADTTSEDPTEPRRMNIYTKHRNEMEKSIQRLQKMDRYGFFLEDAPPHLDEIYDDDSDSDSSDEDPDSDDEGEKIRDRKVVTFPDQPPYNFMVVKKRFAAGRYDLDMVALEQKRLSGIKSILDANYARSSSLAAEHNSGGTRSDELDYKKLAKTMLHPLGVDWELLKSDVSAMCDAALMRDPDGVSLGTGHLGFTAMKVKHLMEEMYNSYGMKRKLEMEESETRHKHQKMLMNCGNTEAAMQGKWRKNAFPERKYQRLETASVICDGLSKEDKSYAMYELETSLPDSFVGLAYMYDDAGQQSETWMKTVADETSKAKKSRKKKKGTDDVDREKEKAEEAAKALAKDDGVTRAQLETTLHTLKIQVQDRVMTDLGVMYQSEARSANWYDGDKDRNYDGGDAEVEQGTLVSKNMPSKWGGSPAEVAEQEVWGIDCYTRKNVMVVIESEFNAEIATEFVEKWLPPAINACPVHIAHKMSMAARILEGLPLPDDINQGGPSNNSDTVDEEADTVQSSDAAASIADSIRPTENAPEKATVEDAANETDTQLLDTTANSSTAPVSNDVPSKSQDTSVFLRNALKEKIATFGPPWLKAAARLIRLNADSMDDDFFRIHPKGHGSVVIDEHGLKTNSLVTYYRGEVFPAWRWCEKLDAIEHVQKQLGLRPNLPDFYNMAMERPMKDPRGYSLLFVDASRKSGLGSSFSHSCNPTCEVRVVALNGKLSLAMTTLRDLEVGEELTFDYNAVTESLNEYRFAVCLCGQKNCRGSFLHFATADCYQQVLSRNSPIAARFANLVRGCMKQVMSKEDSELLVKHGFNTAAFGAVSFNHHAASAGSSSTLDSIDNVPIWLRTFVADCLRYIEYERRALPVALLCNQMDRIEKVKKEEKVKKKQKSVAKKEKKEKPDISVDKSKSISGSRPKTSWMFFLDCKRDHFKTVVQKKHGSKLKGLEFAQEVSREASRVFKQLSDSKKEAWKKKAIADWKKNGGEEKARLEEKRQRELGKKDPAETMEADEDEDESAPTEHDANFEAKTISFADADAEGCSAMEQRIQQLAQSLSRVGRVLDRHRESVFGRSTDPITDVNSDVLRKLVPTPLNIMSDKDLVDWIWEDPSGIIKSLFSMVEKHFPKESLLRELLSATKVKYKLRLTNKNTSDAKKVTKEALVQLRKNIVDFLSFADKSMNEARKEKNREKDRLRREKAKKESSQEDASSPTPVATFEDKDTVDDQNPTKDLQAEFAPSDTQEVLPQNESAPSSVVPTNHPGCDNDSLVDENRHIDVESATNKDDLQHTDDCEKLNQSSDEVMRIRGGGESPAPEKEADRNAVSVAVDAAPSKSPHSSNLQASEPKPPFQSVEPKPAGLGLLTQALDSIGSLNPPSRSVLEGNMNEGMDLSNEFSQQQQSKPVVDDSQLHDGNRSDHMKTEKWVSSSDVAVGAEEIHKDMSSGANTNDSASKNVKCTDTSSEITPSASSAVTHGPTNVTSKDTNHGDHEDREIFTAPSMDSLLSAAKELNEEHASVHDSTNTTTAQSPTSTSSSPKKKAPPMSQEQVAYLKKWLFDHATHPYPTPEEKDVMTNHLGIERKRLESWLVRNRRALLSGDREVQMKWKKRDHEHWTEFRKKRYMLEATADLLLMYANTTTFFMLESFNRFDSTAIEVYARELGNAVPLRFALGPHRSQHTSNASPSLEQEGGKDSGVISGGRRKEKIQQKDIPAADTSSSFEEELCSPDDVIDNVTVDYSGEYVLSQLLQWVNGGIGQAKGLPDCYGCITLPPISGCWEDKECDEVKLPNYTRHNRAKATEYVAKVRPKLAEWFLDRYQRGSPWEKDLAKFFCSSDISAPNPTVPMGSPIIDYLITGMDENIKKISAALSGKEDEESDETKTKRSKLSTSDRLQSTMDEGMPAQAVANWVQCEDPQCLKWRKLPWHVDVDLLPEKFYCKDNIWNPNRQTCDATEDDWDMDDAPIKFDSNQNFEVGAWFDVQREGKIGYSEAQVVELDFDSNVRRVKFTFYRLSNDRDEWVEVGSPRIAPHHSYTPRPFVGGAKRKIDEVQSQGESIDPKSSTAFDPKALMSFTKPVNDYMQTWLSINSENPIPSTEQKSKIMSDTGLSESQVNDWLERAKKKARQKDSMTEEQRKERDQKKKLNDEMNNFLSAWLLRPENVRVDNPIAAATPNADAKEWMAKKLGVDRSRVDSWFYRRRKKLKKQHLSGSPGQTSHHSVTTPQIQTLSTTNPNLNLPSVHQLPQNRTDNVQASVSHNQQSPPQLQNPNAVGQSAATTSCNSAPSSTKKESGLSEEAKQYLTQWIMKTSNPYPSKEMKDKIMAHFKIDNPRTLDGFLTRARKKLNLQNKQAGNKVSAKTDQPRPGMASAASQPAQINRPQPGMGSMASQSAQPSEMNRPHPGVVSTVNQHANTNSAQMGHSRVAVGTAQVNRPQPMSTAVPPTGVSVQRNSTQNATSGSLQSVSSIASENRKGDTSIGTNLDSLLTAVEMVNNRNQFTNPQPTHRPAPNQVGQQKSFAYPTAVVERPNYHGHQQQRFSHSPSTASGGNAANFQFVQPRNGSSYHSEQQHQQHHFLPAPRPPHPPQYEPARQSLMTSYQNLHGMEIHNRLSNHTSPAETETMAQQHPIQVDQGKPNNQASNFTANTTNGTQAYQKTQQNFHGQHPNK